MYVVIQKLKNFNDKIYKRIMFGTDFKLYDTNIQKNNIFD